jgi:hypothetical protein
MAVFPSIWGLVAAGVAMVLLKLPAQSPNESERNDLPLLPPYIGHNLGQ